MLIKSAKNYFNNNEPAWYFDKFIELKLKLFILNSSRNSQNNPSLQSKLEYLIRVIHKLINVVLDQQRTI